jgi:hypothetical protein
VVGAGCDARLLDVGEAGDGPELGLGGGVGIGRLDRPAVMLQPREHVGRARRAVLDQPGDRRRRAVGRRPHSPGHGHDEYRQTGPVREIVGHGRSAMHSMIVVNTSARAEALDRRLSLCLVSWPLEALGCAPRPLQRSFPAREDLLDALVDAHERVVWEVTDGFPPSRLGGHSRLLLVPSSDGVAKRKSNPFRRPC